MSDFNHFDVIDPKATEFGEITQHNGYYVVQGKGRRAGVSRNAEIKSKSKSIKIWSLYSRRMMKEFLPQGMVQKQP